MADNSVHPVDEVLPPGRLTALGIQHVLVMYAGAVAVPFIIAGALGLPPEVRTMLINADLFACGVATLVLRTLPPVVAPPQAESSGRIARETR